MIHLQTSCHFTNPIHSDRPSVEQKIHPPRFAPATPALLEAFMNHNSYIMQWDGGVELLPAVRKATPPC
jgi:hypothetical protein